MVLDPEEDIVKVPQFFPHFDQAVLQYMQYNMISVSVLINAVGVMNSPGMSLMISAVLLSVYTMRAQRLFE